MKYALQCLIAAVPLVAAAPALAQQVIPNHLDCHIDEISREMECPEVVPLQTGRASGVEPVAPDPAPAAPVASAADTADEKPRRSKTYPSCRTYRSYDAATSSFLGYDGIRHHCP